MNKTIYWNGRNWTISDLAEHVGINSSTLYYRLFRYGWPVSRAVSQPVAASKRRKNKPKNFYHYQGRHWSIKELSELTGIAETTLRFRLNEMQWSVSRAINTPVCLRKSRNRL